MNDYIMIKYTIKYAVTPTVKFFPAKLVSMFAEPTENMNTAFLYLTHILVQDIDLSTVTKNQLGS